MKTNDYITTGQVILGFLIYGFIGKADCGGSLRIALWRISYAILGIVLLQIIKKLRPLQKRKRADAQIKTRNYYINFYDLSQEEK